MATKLTFKQFAEFIYSDHTVDIFPDIAWGYDAKFPNQRVAWLERELETRYKLYLENPDDTLTDSNTETADTDFDSTETAEDSTDE
jgi:hypothetical protein